MRSTLLSMHNQWLMIVVGNNRDDGTTLYTMQSLEKVVEKDFLLHILILNNQTECG